MVNSADSKLAPILLFTFNRPKHTASTLESLSRNNLASQSDLIIFSDGPKRPDQKPAVAEVRKLIANIQGFKSTQVFHADHNKGLANSIIGGVDRVIKTERKVIVLEDDILTAPEFLTYMNRALLYYENSKNIWSISGYGPPLTFPSNFQEPVYLAPRSGSWGWGTWLDRWTQVDWTIADFAEFFSDSRAKRVFNKGGNDLTHMLTLQMLGRIDSWAIRWCYNQFKHGMYTLFPRDSLTRNFGFDGTGTHCGDAGEPLAHLEFKASPSLPDSLLLDPAIQRSFQKFHDYSLQKLPRALASRAKSYLSARRLLVVKKHQNGPSIDRKGPQRTAMTVKHTD